MLLGNPSKEEISFGYGKVPSSLVEFVKSEEDGEWKRLGSGKGWGMELSLQRQ